MIDFKEIIGKGNFYFLRHGQSTGNVAGIAQGRVDLNLSQVGVEQAKGVARWLKGRNLSIIVSSPLSRASQTASIIADELDLGPVTMLTALNEVDIGLFSGMSHKEIRKRYPMEHRQFRQSSWDGVPGAEKSPDLYQRAEILWSILFDQFREGKTNILSVTHSGLLQWILKVTVGQMSWLPLFPIGNCCIYHLALDNQLIPPDASYARETSAYYYAWHYHDFLHNDK